MKRYCLDARTATNHFPGIGRYVSNLARALVDELAADEQLLLVHDPDQPSRWQLPPQGAQVRWLSVHASPFSLKQQWAVPQRLLRARPAVYHSPYYLMPYAVRAPTLVTIHDLIPQHFPEYVSPRARALFRVTTALALRRARHIIAVSEATRQDLLAAYPLVPQQVSTVPHAPDPHFGPQSAETIARLCRGYYLEEPFVLYVGSNKPHKNLPRLLEAWYQARLPGTLVIAGSWEEQFAESKARADDLELSNVRFLGPIPEADLPALYAAAAIFVFPSLYEGFGLPVIEAMACGTPVLCADSSSLPEVAGEAALLFDPRDTAALAAALTRLWHDDGLRRDYAEMGLRLAGRFTWQRTARETLAHYRRVAAGG